MPKIKEKNKGFCPKCGSEIDIKNDQFCIKCGFQFSTRKKKSSSLKLYLAVIIFLILLWIVIRILTKNPIIPDFSFIKNITAQKP